MLKRQQKPVFAHLAPLKKGGRQGVNFVLRSWKERGASPKNPNSPLSSQSGFSLLECLMAIIVVSILLAAVGPVIALSVATRVQARRVELASHAAKSFIDSVRSGKIDPSGIVPVQLNEVTVGTDGKKTFAPDRLSFTATPPPASSELTSSNCSDNLTVNPLYPYCQTRTSTLYCVDQDGGGCSNTSPRDLIVQSFRSVTPTQAAAEALPGFDPKTINKNGYILGVRVYRADAFDGNGTLKVSSDPNLNERQKRAATFAGGSGARYVPLVEMTTEIGVQGTSFQDLCNRVGGCASGTTNQN